MSVHADIPPTRVWVDGVALTGKSAEPRIKATAYAVSSYAGHALTFKVQLHDGALFDYMPIHWINLTEKSMHDGHVFMSELLFGVNCPDEHVVTSQHVHLELQTFHCFFRNQDAWRSGRYITSLDWPRANTSATLVALENGQFCAAPNYRCVVGGSRPPTKLPSYIKQRETFVAVRA